MIVSTGLFLGCGQKQAHVPVTVPDSDIAAAVYREYENTIQITNHNAAISISGLPEAYTSEETTILLVNCVNGEVFSQNGEKVIFFNHMPSGTYAIQAYSEDANGPVSLSSCELMIDISYGVEENQSKWVEL